MSAFKAKSDAPAVGILNATNLERHSSLYWLTFSLQLAWLSMWTCCWTPYQCYVVLSIHFQYYDVWLSACANCPVPWTSDDKCRTAAPSFRQDAFPDVRPTFPSLQMLSFDISYTRTVCLKMAKKNDCQTWRGCKITFFTRTDMHFSDVSFHILNQSEFLEAITALMWFVRGMNSLMDF